MRAASLCKQGDGVLTDSESRLVPDIDAKSISVRDVELAWPADVELEYVPNESEERGKLRLSWLLGPA